MSAGWLKRRWRTPDYLRADKDPDAPRRGLRDLARDFHVGNAGSADAMRAAFLRQVQPEDEERTH